MSTKFPRCWIFDENHSVCPKGKGLCGPIWIEHWREVEIVGEDRVSWVTKCCLKIPKRGHSKIAFSWEEVKQHEWVHENSHLIGQQVGRIRNYTLLLQIEELLREALQ